MLLRFVSENEIAYWFPDADDVANHRDSAVEDPETGHHLKSDLQSIYDWTEAAELFDEDPLDEIGTLLDELETKFPEVTAAVAKAECKRLDSGRALYRNALAGINLLNQSIDFALANDLDTVAVFCVTQKIELENQIGPISDSSFETARNLIERKSESDDPHLGDLATLFDLFTDYFNPDQRQTDNGLKAFSAGIQIANLYRDEGGFYQERDIVSGLIDLSKALDIDIGRLKIRYKETYDRGADWQAERGASLEASELLDGLQDETVMDVLSEQEKRQWKSRLRDAVQTAARELKDEGMSTDSTYQRVLHQQIVDKVVAQFKHVKDTYDVDAAIYWLSMNSELIPSFSRPEDDLDSGISDILTRVGLSIGGHLNYLDPNESEISARYTRECLISIPVFVSVISTLIKQRELRENDIYEFINRVSEPSAVLQLQPFIENIFERRHREAIHVGIPQLESLIYTLLLEEGEDVDALVKDGTGHRTLGSLLPVLENYVGEDFNQYLQYIYNEPVAELFGGNIRNRVAHGLLHPRSNHQYLSLLLLGDILRIITRFDATDLQAEYGIIAAPWLETPDNLPSIPIVVKNYQSPDLPEETDVVEFIKSSQPSVEEVAEEFGISFKLAIGMVRLLDSLGKVSFDEDNNSVDTV